MYLKLMIDGVGSQPFSAIGMAPIAEPAVSYKAQVLEASRAQYGRLRADVEAYTRLQMLGPESEARSVSVQSPRVEPTPRPTPPVSRPQSGPRPSVPPLTRTPQSPRPPREDRPHDRRVEPTKRPIPALPPDEPGSGFMNLKQFSIPPRHSEPRRDNRPPERRPLSIEDKRAHIEGSKNDLRAALASLVGPTPTPKAPEAPKAQVGSPRPQNIQPKETPKPRPTGTGKDEVPEDVLRKILE